MIFDEIITEFDIKFKKSNFKFLRNFYDAGQNGVDEF